MNAARDRMRRTGAPGDWDAVTYDRISDPQARWAVAVVERIEGEPRTILDAGCGTGRVTELLLRRFARVDVIGVDASATMIDQATSRLAPYAGRVKLLHSDLLEPLPLDDRVDVVFSNAVFHWIGDHPRLFRNLAGALRPGGQLVAQWGGHRNIYRLLSVVREQGGPDLTGNFTTPEQSHADLEAAGFTEVRTWAHPDPADFDSREEFEQYLDTICLRTYVDGLEPSERSQFIRAVADRLPERRIDYVRMNAVARAPAP